MCPRGPRMLWALRSSCMCVGISPEWSKTLTRSLYLLLQLAAGRCLLHVRLKSELQSFPKLYETVRALGTGHHFFQFPHMFFLNLAIVGSDCGSGSPRARRSGHGKSRVRGQRNHRLLHGVSAPPRGQRSLWSVCTERLSVEH